MKKINKLEAEMNDIRPKAQNANTFYNNYGRCCPMNKHNI